MQPPLCQLVASASSSDMAAEGNNSKRMKTIDAQILLQSITMPPRHGGLLV